MSAGYRVNLGIIHGNQFKLYNVYEVPQNVQHNWNSKSQFALAYLFCLYYLIFWQRSFKLIKVALYSRLKFDTWCLFELAKNFSSLNGYKTSISSSSLLLVWCFATIIDRRAEFCNFIKNNFCLLKNQQLMNSGDFSIFLNGILLVET